MNKRLLSIIFSLLIVYNILVILLFQVESNFDGGNIKSLADAYWYSLVTLTTVGYGDFYPVTFWGRLYGILFVAASLGIIGFLFSKVGIVLKDYLHKKKQGYFGTDMENHCILIGWKSQTKEIAEGILNANETLAIVTDKKEDIDYIKEIFPQKNCFCLYTELHNYKNLEKVNIEKAKRVYLDFEEDSQALVYAINVKKNFKDVRFVVALNNPELKESFGFLGDNYIISKEEIVSRFAASYIFEPYAAMITEDIMTTSTEEGNLDFHQYKLEPNSAFIGQDYSVVFSLLKEKYNAVLVGIARNEKVYKNPKQMMIEQGDYLIFIGDIHALEDVKIH